MEAEKNLASLLFKTYALNLTLKIYRFNNK